MSKVFEVGSSRFSLVVSNQEGVNPFVVVADHRVIDAVWTPTKSSYLA